MKPLASMDVIRDEQRIFDPYTDDFHDATENGGHERQGWVLFITKSGIYTIPVLQCQEKVLLLFSTGYASTDAFLLALVSSVGSDAGGTPALRRDRLTDEQKLGRLRAF